MVSFQKDLFNKKTNLGLILSFLLFDSLIVDFNAKTNLIEMSNKA